MNNVEAKFILKGYRPNGADANDATFGAALSQAGQDPALRAWFAQEQAFDAAVVAKLGEVPVPAGLREAILAGGRVSDTPRRGWWQHPALLAVAASIAVVLATTMALWPKQAAARNGLVDLAVDDTLYNKAHGGHGAEAGALQSMLVESSTHIGDSLPIDFAALRKAGCRTLDFEGRPVLEVCFKRNGSWFHCYIAQRHDFPALAAAVAPVLADEDGASVATWADTSHLFVMVTKAGHSSLEKLL
jgi:hypothetical protein